MKEKIIKYFWYLIDRNKVCWSIFKRNKWR